VDSVLFDLARSDHRYAYEAYQFVCEAVTFTQQRLGLLDEDDDLPEELAPEGHVSGEQLLRGGCALAVREFGLMASLVFQRWGIHNTDDFGEVVFRLIEARKLSRSDEDDPTDYQDVFDLMAALKEGYEFDAAAYPARKADA
jgi:uncharacterized repeat protein (TIGR04138 family)